MIGLAWSNRKEKLPRILGIFDFPNIMVFKEAFESREERQAVEQYLLKLVTKESE